MYHMYYMGHMACFNREGPNFRESCKGGVARERLNVKLALDIKTRKNNNNNALSEYN